MNVWLIKLEEYTPLDSEGRTYRMGMLEQSLIDAGHTTLRWCSTFKNKEHVYRFRKTTVQNIGERRDVFFLHTAVDYRSSTSPLRFLNNEILARKLIYHGKRQRKKPDLIVCSMPAPCCCSAAARLAKYFDVPLVIDARDYWPDIIMSELNSFKRLLALPLIYRMKQHLRFATRSAASLVGITEFFVEHLVNYSDRPRSANDREFPLGYFAPMRPRQCSVSDNRFGVPDGRRLVYFAGTLNSTVFKAFEPVRYAAASMPDHCFVICGDGKFFKALVESCSELPNIIFTGRLSSEELEFFSYHAHVALLPVERRIDYMNSLSNKFFEYLSCGLPVVTNLDGLAGQTLVHNKCGMIYRNGLELVEVLSRFATDLELHKEYSANATSTFFQRFDGHAVYGSFVEHLEMLVDKNSQLI